MDLSSPDTFEATAEPACPFHAQGADSRRTAPDRGARPGDVAPGEGDVWNVHGFAAARTILRGDGTRQAGFKAEMLQKLRQKGNSPILYLDGKVHHEQRRLTAPFFTPKTVSARYRPLMERLADKVIGEFRAKRKGELSSMGMEMAVGVAGEVVGLTDSLTRGMDKRLNAFFDGDFSPKTNIFSKVAEAVGTQWHVLLFTMLDVMPAIRKRRKQPKEDVISHLIGQGYSAADMLTECITYAAAGMVTTREFITVCAWHMLENPELAGRYRSADEAGRNAILEELLRLEPVVGTLFRRALEDIDVGDTKIPAGALIAIDVRGANSDPSIVGEAPLDVRPDRCPASRAAPSVISFGDGHHRCPGSFLALQETDIFLTRLLAVPGLKLDRPPNVTWNDLVTGYELRNCIISCD